MWDTDQLRVVEAPSTARLLVEAGPGTGKTAVACGRVAHLIRNGVEPSNILIISYTQSAVKEVRNRISTFLEKKELASSLQIFTLDKQAWRLKKGFSEKKDENFLDSYDDNIEEVIRLIRDGNIYLHEDIGTLEHVIIDETQDLVDIRNHLAYHYIMSLPESCGITVFCDSAQAIYDYSTDKAIEPLKIRLQSSRAGFEDVFLEKIYRTGSDKMSKIFHAGRSIVLRSDLKPAEKYKKLYELQKKEYGPPIRKLDFEWLLDSSHGTKMILFRSKSRVYDFSELLSKNNVRHKIRIGDQRKYVDPWVGYLLHKYKGEEEITKDVFLDYWDEFIEPHQGRSVDFEVAWRTLYALASTRKGQINLSRIVALIARKKPPLELTSSEVDGSLVLGTIHASKGREADHVILELDRNKATGTKKINDEETRIIFVGLTRAKQSVSFFIPHEYEIDCKWVYKNKYKGCIAGISEGPAEDLTTVRLAVFDDEMFDFNWINSGKNEILRIEKIRSLVQFNKAQKFLYENRSSYFMARLKKIKVGIDQGSYYEIYALNRDNSELLLGKTTTSFTSHLITALKRICGSGQNFALPDLVFLYCQGARTYTKFLEDREIIKSEEHPVYLVPIYSEFVLFHIAMQRNIRARVDQLRDALDLKKELEDEL